MSLSDWIDQQHNEPGVTQRTIERLCELGCFQGPINTACEIGPGSGRFLEKILRQCQPKLYEIYETEPDWSEWLAATYSVKRRKADGKSLSATASDSVDLMTSFRVFVALPLLITLRYFSEIVRVMRPGGTVVFDAVTEECMDEETVEKWLASGSTYPVVILRHSIIRFFEERGFWMTGNFFMPLRPGRSEYFVFRAPQIKSAVQKTAQIFAQPTSSSDRAEAMAQ